MAAPTKILLVLLCTLTVVAMFAEVSDAKTFDFSGIIGSKPCQGIDCPQNYQAKRYKTGCKFHFLCGKGRKLLEDNNNDNDNNNNDNNTSDENALENLWDRYGKDQIEGFFDKIYNELKGSDQ